MVRSMRGGTAYLHFFGRGWDAPGARRRAETMVFAPTKTPNVLAAPNGGTAIRSAVKNRAANRDLTWTSMAYDRLVPEGLNGSVEISTKLRLPFASSRLNHL